jgi:hypothetical protein
MGIEDKVSFSTCIPGIHLRRINGLLATYHSFASSTSSQIFSSKNRKINIPFSTEKSPTSPNCFNIAYTNFLTRKKERALSRNWPTRLELHLAIPSSTYSSGGETIT